jgi:glycosyltransferase involved in cell wall biosynthesis
MTCTPGIDDYVRDRETGFLSEPGDSTALANSIITSLDTDTAREVGARGREAVERRHSTDLLAERLAAILAL